MLVRLGGGRSCLARLWTHLCHQRSSRKIDIGQGKHRERACGVLGQAPVAHLTEAPKAFDDAEHMLGPRPDARLVAVLRLLDLVDYAAVVADPVVGEVPGPRRLAGNEFLLAGIGAVAIDAPLVAV